MHVCAQVSIPEHPYAACRQYVAENHFSSLQEVLATFSWLYDTWEGVVSKTFLGMSCMAEPVKVLRTH